MRNGERSSPPPGETAEIDLSALTSPEKPAGAGSPTIRLATKKPGRGGVPELMGPDRQVDRGASEDEQREQATCRFFGHTRSSTASSLPRAEARSRACVPE